MSYMNKAKKYEVTLVLTERELKALHFCTGTYGVEEWAQGVLGDALEDMVAEWAEGERVAGRCPWHGGKASKENPCEACLSE